MERIKRDSFLKELYKRAKKVSINKDTIIFYQINDKLNENVIKNRITIPIRDIAIKQNNLIINLD